MSHSEDYDYYTVWSVTTFEIGGTSFVGSIAGTQQDAISRFLEQCCEAGTQWNTLEQQGYMCVKSVASVSRADRQFNKAKHNGWCVWNSSGLPYVPSINSTQRGCIGRFLAECCEPFTEWKSAQGEGTKCWPVQVMLTLTDGAYIRKTIRRPVKLIAAKARSWIPNEAGHYESNK